MWYNYFTKVKNSIIKNNFMSKKSKEKKEMITGVAIFGVGVIFGIFFFAVLMASMLPPKSTEQPSDISAPAPSADTISSVARKAYETYTGTPVTPEQQEEIDEYAQLAVDMMAQYQVKYSYAKSCADVETLPEYGIDYPAPNPFADNDLIATVPQNFAIDPNDIQNANASNIATIATKYIKQLKKAKYKNITVPESCSTLQTTASDGTTQSDATVQEAICLTQAHLDALQQYSQEPGTQVPSEAIPYINMLVEICKQAKAVGIPCNAYISGSAPCSLLMSNGCSVEGATGSCLQ